MPTTTTTTTAATTGATATRPPSGLRWLGYVGTVLACAWLATQLFYFAQIAVWNVVNPRTTA
ncbi:MAG TPA: monofunctional biosynthetic peptidoglycan transglycosylase, partial [Paraburkholderia sp.]